MGRTKGKEDGTGTGHLSQIVSRSMRWIFFVFILGNLELFIHGHRTMIYILSLTILNRDFTFLMHLIFSFLTVQVIPLSI